MISLRLQKASKYLEGYNCLADCGTDHALLPIYAVENDLVKKAYASDNKIGPYENAVKNIKNANLNESVIPVFAEGLTYLNSEVDIVSILGMGGRMIVSILENADLHNVKRLILIANSENSILREFLSKNYWKITAEELIKEKNKYYQLMVLEKGEMTLSNIEMEFGPLIIKSKSLFLKEMIAKLIDKLLMAKKNAKTEKAVLTIEKRIKELKEVIK
jgi:tRNA (adenine22-N1)-methyltransferase